MDYTITAKIQIIVDDSQKHLLFDVMKAYTDACNYVSEYIFNTHDLNQSSINKSLYLNLRDQFKLRSQMAQSVIKTVLARYGTIVTNQNAWIKPEFKKQSYELVWNRDYSLVGDKFSVNTLSGRIKLSYYSNAMQKYFDKSIYKFGTAKLVYKHKKFFLHVPVTCDLNECQLSDISNVVGVDLGVNFVVTSYDSKHKTTFYSGKQIKQKHSYYKELRKQLQQVKTPSSRRRLKAIGQRENRWINDVNHCISKSLVANNPEHTLFVLEDLTGVRNATEKVRKKNRYVMVSWSFYDLRQKITYKSLKYNSLTVAVNPKYTSQCCPICGHTEKSNRNKVMHLFACKNCGYKSNDDRIGAMNLYRKGIEHLNASVPDTVVQEQVS